MTDAQPTPHVDMLWARLVATLCPLLPEAKDELFLAAIHNDLNDLERELTDATTVLADVRRALEEALEEVESRHRKSLQTEKDTNDMFTKMSEQLEAVFASKDHLTAESARLRADLAAARAEAETHERRALTAMLLRIRHEVFFHMGGIGEKAFTREYLAGIGDYERQIAKEQGIQID